MEFDRRVLRKRGVLLRGGEDVGEARVRADSATERGLVRVNAVAATAFMVSAVAAFVRPATGDELAVGVANWACFAGAGAMQEFERP